MVVDYYKLQNEVMKAAWNYFTKNKNMNWFFGTDDNSLYLTDGYGFYIIPKSLMYLNLETVFKNTRPFEGYKKILDGASEADETIMTNRSFILPDKKKTGIVFQIENSEHEEMVVDKDLLKFFDLSLCHFKAASKKSLLYIFADDTLLGAVLPVRMDI